MICATCRDTGRTSRVYSRHRSQSLMGFESFWDEHGVRHVHDPNIVRQVFECSNGHTCVTETSPACPVSSCDYGKKKEGAEQ